MKTSDFESNFTAWLDGQLSPEDAAAFEQEMRARGFDPATERVAAEKTGSLLRENSSVPPLPHADFFQHQLMRRIEREQAAAQPEPKAARTPWWTFPRLAWASAFCLLMAFALTKSLIPAGGTKEGSNYFASIVDARTFESAISVETVYDPRDNVTVLWLNGLDYMSGDIVVQ